jgi:putative transposase
LNSNATGQMYLWRKLDDKQRKELLEFRRVNKRPLHSPRHVQGQNGRYLLTAACYEHRDIIGLNPARMDDFSERLLRAVGPHCEEIYAWCVLPNHYHVLVLIRKLKDLFRDIGFLHGRTSFEWNGEDNERGRKVWFNCAETGMKSDRHFWASLNYVHNNPVHHGYVRRWQEWPFSAVQVLLSNTAMSVPWQFGKNILLRGMERIGTRQRYD